MNADGISAIWSEARRKTVRLHFLSGGRLRMRRDIYYPGAAPEERFELPVSCALLKHAQGNVLFDTGCHPGAAEDGEARWGRMVKFMTPIYRAEDAVVGQLSKAGLGADDIDLVVCSHLHTDHCGCNSFFRRATVVCSAEELTSAQSDTSGAYIAEDWEGSGPIETIAGQRDLLGDGRMTLIEAPGHTPGMLVAHVVLDTQTFVLASDAAPVRETLDQRYTPKGTWNVDIALKSLDEIARLERDGSKVIFGHDEAQWRQIRTGAEFYE